MRTTGDQWITLRASNTEHMSISWRHNEIKVFLKSYICVILVLLQGNPASYVMAYKTQKA